ncbi:MAG: asparagine synthase (glutamine-hydrolyzing) [Pseudorhodoplanes sp.]|uniref:asparagine synthase (glutamine-hydrolyzing) n=1 Tax=Pseudorhodoplanes sp. TaxID=1934341 RepID=UPI003D0E69EC
MCGIAGLFDLHRSPREAEPAAAAERMADTMAHRGPDGFGTWGDANAGIGLAHRRLAIVDLSMTGAQPMHSADGRFVITYNGEVYNFEDLRAELVALGHGFRGTSDTEVMLASFVQWGVQEAVRRFVGMFAFAMFDRRERSLHLVRDRVGVKPLYWTIQDGTLLFGSELRALMAHPAFRRDVDRDALSAVVAYSYVPAPATVFRNVHKLPPGAILSVAAGGEPSIEHYWRIEEIAAKRGSTTLDHGEAVDALDALLRDSIRRRMVADVPVGAFLSGGIDSSIVTALMQAESNTPVRSFTVGFSDTAYDESAIARQVAQHLRTDHTEIRLDASDALDLVPKIPDWFDEPFADSSQLPTYLVAQATRRHVTVALSGDGGDELFAGYPKYAWLDQVWRAAGRLPRPLRALAGGALSHAPEAALRPLAAALLDAGRAERIGEKSRRLGLALSACDPDRASLALARVGLDRNIVTGASHGYRLTPLQGLSSHLPDLVSRMQVNDFVTYLPDDILTKVDRCTMAVSLEAREPLLDHRLIEFVWSLPRDVHQSGGQKGLLRAVLGRYVPQAWTDRPKRGFSVPLAEWLRGQLRGWASDLLAPSLVRAEGLLDPAAVDRVWQRHLKGTESNATGLWNILMIRAWSERWLK